MESHMLRLALAGAALILATYGLVTIVAPMAWYAAELFVVRFGW